MESNYTHCPLVSVIIPVYNCAPVIMRCLGSIDYDDSEIIVVDDGSTDSLTQVVEEYARDHSNIRLIQKPHGGVSSARNQGIDTAKGKYILFIDADDYLVPEGIKRIVDIAEKNNADVVKYLIQSVSNTAPIDRTSVLDFPIQSEEINGKGQALLRYDISDYHVVDGLFLRTTICDNGIRFHTDLHLREDDVFMGEFYCHASKVVITNLPLYRYVRSSVFSSTHNQSVSRQRILIQSAELAIRYRKNCVTEFFPQALSMERLKYMRFVCFPKSALSAGYSLKEYKQILDRFKELGCYPLDYRWVHVARVDGTMKGRIKYFIKTFSCNHPDIAYPVLKLFKACRS